MKRIGDLDVDSFYRAIDFLGERITDSIKRIESTKESIWAIQPKARSWFYGILTVCGIVVSLVTLFAEWNGWNPSALLAVFNEIGIGIFSSVVIVWFLFQATDCVLPRIKSIKIKIMGWGDPYREKLREEGRKEIRQKEIDKQSRFEQGLRDQGVSEEKIRNARKFLDSYSR